MHITASKHSSTAKKNALCLCHAEELKIPVSCMTNVLLPLPRVNEILTGTVGE